MKKIIFSFSFIVLTVLIVPLNAQTPDYDHHPYEYAQEELFLTSFGVREIYESDDCVMAQAMMNKFYNAETRGDEKEKYNYLRSISFFYCKEAFNFLETQIKNNPNETDRCNAIMFLAWMLNPDYLPCILEYAKKDKLSIQEKAAIATAFMVFGIHDANLDLKEQAIKMLDEICVGAPVNILTYCILNYFNLGGDVAIKFFTAQLKQEEFKLYAALFLAQLGEHKQAFPILARALSSEDTYEVYVAVTGLAAIGTEEAMKLIRNLPPEKNKHKLKKPQINFDIMNIKEGDKL